MCTIEYLRPEIPLSTKVPLAFFSYSREDSKFALRLAEDLKTAGANVWMDQLDIEPGQEWDDAIEHAVSESARMLLILSPASVQSKNVRNEIAVAIDENKTIIPVLYQDCVVPLNLRRVQHIDFRTDYAQGLGRLLKVLAVGSQPGQGDRERQAAEEKARHDELDRQRTPAEQARLEEDRRQAAAEKARVEQQELERLKQERSRAAISPASPGWTKIALAVLGVLIVASVSYFALRPKQEVKTEPSNPPAAGKDVADTTSADKHATDRPAPATVASPPVDTRTSQRKSEPNTSEWVQQFLYAWQGPSVGALRPFFDDTVSPYFRFPTASWADVAKDKQYYFDRFPTLHYTLLGQPTYTPQQEGQGVLDFGLRYSAIRKDGQTLEGTEYLTVNIRSVDGQWKITGMKGGTVRR